MSTTRRDIAEAFRKAGVVAGDTVMFHGSLKSLGFVEGGAVSVYDGILDAAGPGGTVAAATLWYNGNPEECPKELFDVNTSPTWTGALAETLRRDERSCRSNSFSHSVSAIGARAEELTADHGKGRAYPSPWSEQSFAEISPWSKFYQWNAFYAFIGVDMNSCTMKHYIESRFVEGLLRSLPPERYDEFRNQLAKDCKSTFWIFYPGTVMREALEERGLVQRTPIGNTTLLSIRTRPLVEATLEILHADPEKWCTPEFYQWILSLEKARSC
ncbi:MAG: AAC(3) family N-acetyltransferase [Lentisphaeria bacterium]|nr:AAC(3) family N-acetyltransferase [Lentisphaeria bacterium]